MAETTNLGKVVITPKGEHSTATAYVRLDLVTYNGSSYLSKQDVPTGVAIDNTAYWFCMAKGTYQIWLDEGNTGSASDYLNSVTAYGNAVLGGYTGTEADFYEDLASVSDALTSADIADNLTTTAKGLVLDASQGKILKGLVDNKIDKSSITSELGDSEELVMSQKGVKTEVQKLQLADTEQSHSIKTIEDTLNSININQEATAEAEGYGTVSLPKNAANGGMSVKLEGLTAENLVVNGDFRDGIDNWGVYRSILTLTESTLQVTKDPIFPSSNLLQANSIFPTIVGDKYYLKAKVRVLDSVCSTIVFNRPDSSFAPITAPSENMWYEVSATRIATHTDGVFLTAVYPTAIDANNKTFEIDRKMGVTCINLTATFGAGNEPTVEECDAMFADYFEGVKSFEPTGRVRSVDALGLNPTNLYLQSPVLRSNGDVKDEIRKGANEYELVKRVGVGALGSELIAGGNFESGLIGSKLDGLGSESTWTLNTVSPISGTQDGKLTIITGASNRPTIRWNLNSVEGETYRFRMKYKVNSGAFSIAIMYANNTGVVPIINNDGNIHSIDFTYKASTSLSNYACAVYFNTSSGVEMQIDDVSIMKVLPNEGAILGTSSRFTYLSNGDVLYTLATPVITQIPYAGLLNSNSNGTVYHEPVIADAGVYGTNLEIQATDYPISEIEKIIKWENGVEYLLDATDAVIAIDGLSFTHPDLADGNLVMFTYAYNLESTVGKMTLTHYDSRYVIADTANGKFYKPTIVSTNGVATINLEEV
jgi:hypothetical protein